MYNECNSLTSQCKILLDGWVDVPLKLIILILTYFKLNKNMLLTPLLNNKHNNEKLAESIGWLYRFYFDFCYITNSCSIKSPFPPGFSWLSFSLYICPYHLLPPAGLPYYILCPHRADVDKSLVVGQHWHVHVSRFIEECYLCICPCFSSNVPHVLFVLLGWF